MGFIYLTPNYGDSDTVVNWRIVLPFFHVYLLATRFTKELIPQFSSISTLNLRTSPRQNEADDLTFILYKLEAMQKLKSGSSFNMKDLFPSSTLSFDLRFPQHFSYEETGYQVTSKNFNEFVNTRVYQKAQRAFLNASNSMFADSFIFLITEAKSLFVILIQSKQSVTSRKKILNNCEPDYYRKGESPAAEQAKSQINFPHLFVYITDNKVRDEVFEKNAVVIGQDDLEEFFGQHVSFRRLYSTLI